jgi:hypothetical protein
LVTNQQLYLAVGIPMLFNAALIGVLIAYINAKFHAVDERFHSVDQRFLSVDQRFLSIEQRFNALDQRFDDMRDLWRSELRRHIEEHP